MTGAQQVIRSLEKHVRKNGGDWKTLLEQRHGNKKREDGCYVFHDGSIIRVSDSKYFFDYK